MDYSFVAVGLVIVAGIVVVVVVVAAAAAAAERVSGQKKSHCMNSY